MLAADTETALIRPLKLAPELACITYSDGEYANIVHWQDSYKTAVWLLEQELTTANGSYDLAVLWAAHPDLRDLIFEGLVAGRYHDVQIRQKLMDIGAGRYRRVFKRFPGEDKPRMLNYSLSDLHARYYGVFMEKDEWRLRYGELRPYPLEQWPEGAVKYATYDAVATARIHDLQIAAAVEQGHTNNLHDEPAQMRAAFALHIASCWGIRADEKQVRRVIDYIDKEQPEFAAHLENVGLARWEKNKQAYVRSEKKAKALMFAAVGDSGELTKTGYKKVKAGLFTKKQALEAGYIKVDEEWCEVSGNEDLVVYYHFRQNQLLRTKLGDIHEAAKAGLPIQTSYEVLMETGRTSSSKNKLIPNSMGVQNPPRKPVMADVLDANGHYVRDKKTGKKKKEPAKDERGRVIGGVRECLIARENNTLIAVDFGLAELVSLAQITYAAFGHSKMRDILNAGQDIHVDFGKEVLAVRKGTKLSYEEAWKLYKNEDKDLKDMRQLAKCFRGDTEVLTRTGWVRMDQLQQGVEIAAASFSDGGHTHIKWEVPTRLTTRVAEELVHLENKNIDLWVTPDHRMAAWRNAEKNPLPQRRDTKTGRMIAQGGKQKKMHLVEEICTPEELVGKRAWPSAGLCEEGSVEVPEQLLRLAVATQADGNYHGKERGVHTDILGREKETGEGEKIRFGFTKQRKIERLRTLLQGMTYTETVVGKLAVPTFYLSTETSQPVRSLLDADKTLPWWWLNLSRRCREIVLEEAQHWDANILDRGRGSWKYCSTLGKNIDVLQAIASITNRKATSSKQNKVKEEHAAVFSLSVKDRPNTRGGQLETTRHTWNSSVFCVTVPSDALLVRYKGKTTICRNCADFGFPGGLGWASFQSYARKAWQVSLTGEEAKQLKAYWLRHFPEMRLYFKWISDLVEAGDGLTDIQQYMSGRWRGRCFYTQAANCLDDETEALTERGWVKGFDLEPGDRLLTKNAETGVLEWHHAARIQKYPNYHGPLVSFETKNFSALTTPNHRWLVNDKKGNVLCKTTEEVGCNGAFSIHRTGAYASTTAVYEDAFVELAGWVLTDGSISQQGKIKRVLVYQSERGNPQKVKQIDALFLRLGLKPSRRSVRHGGIVWKLSDNVPAVHLLHRLFPKRLLTVDFLNQLSRKQAEILWRTMMLGDGSCKGTPTLSRTGHQQHFFTRSKDSADIFQHLCVLVGFASMIKWVDMRKYKPRKSVKMPNIPKTKGIWMVIVLRRETAQIVNWKKRYGIQKTLTQQRREYVGHARVWCPVVQNTYFVARRKGTVYITGNTMFQGLTADAGKAAMFEVTRLCHTVKSSDLYGCHPLLFVHDEIITEAPRDQAAAAAKEMAKVMIEVYSQYTPDVKVTADAHLMDRWSKDARAVHDERGKLLVWEPPEAEDERAEDWLMGIAT